MVSICLILLEPKHFLLYFPVDKTCSVLTRSKITDVEGSTGYLKPGREVNAKWSDRGQKTAIYKGVIVNTDGKQSSTNYLLLVIVRLICNVSISQCVIQGMEVEVIS